MPALVFVFLSFMVVVTIMVMMAKMLVSMFAAPFTAPRVVTMNPVLVAKMPRYPHP